MDKYWFAVGFCMFITLCCGVFIYYSVATNSKLSKKIIELYVEIGKVKRDIKSICAGTVSMGQRLSNQEQYLEVMSYRQDKVEMRSPAASSYSHAAKIVEMGGSEEEVMSSCGLTKAEARLVAMLYNNRQKVESAM